MRLEQEVNIFAKDAIKRRFLAAETSVSVTQGKIAALISESEIQELQNSGTTMYSKLGKLDLNISGLTQQYSNLATKYDSVTNQYTALDSKLSEYKTTVDGLSANLSQVSTRLSNDYSTTETMNAAIKAAVDEISLSISKTYVTSEILSSTKSDLDKQAKDYASNAESSANANTDKLLKDYASNSDLKSAKDRVSVLETWKQEASVKITDSSIVATVTKSAQWADKADKSSLISQINMSTEGITINSSLIKLEGLVTANNYFKINTDGSVETKKAVIGGWNVDNTAIYKDIVSGDTTYRVCFQPPLQSAPDSTWILSCQKKTGEGSTFYGSFVLYSDGKARFGTTYLYPDGSCALGENFKIDASGNVTAGTSKVNSDGSCIFGTNFKIDKAGNMTAGTSKINSDGSCALGTNFKVDKLGNVTIGTSKIKSDGSCVLGTKCTIEKTGAFSLGYLAIDTNGSLKYGDGNIRFSGAGGSGATTLQVKDGHKPVTLGDGFITVQNNNNGNITKIEPVGITTKNLNATGTKKRIVDTENYATRSLYCYEMPSPVFGDVGEAVLDENGKCIIMIDDIFSETIVTNIEYQVFLQKEGQGDAWIEKKEDTYFEVAGTPGLKFAWEIKARQKDYETERLEIFDEEDFTDIDYASEAAEMVDNFYKELEVA